MSRGILVPLDGTPFSEGALRHAIELARRRGCGIEVATVSTPRPSDATPPWAPSRMDWLHEAAVRVSAAGVPVETVILCGEVVDALARHAATGGVDLVVAATHARGVVNRFWVGSVTDRLVRGSPVPVLVVPPPSVRAGRARFRKVVVGLDGSRLAEEVIPVLLDALPGVHYCLARVVIPPEHRIVPAYAPEPVVPPRELVEDEIADAAESLQEIVESLELAGHDVSWSVVTHPSPDTGLLAHASTVDADAVALSTHGLGGLTRALLGSVTDSVIRRSAVPVLVHRPAPRTRRSRRRARSDAALTTR